MNTYPRRHLDKESILDKLQAAKYDPKFLVKKSSPYEGVKNSPSKSAISIFQNPGQWFDMYANEEELLTKVTLLEYLCCIASKSVIDDKEKAAETVNAIWNMFDDDYTGSIEKESFIGPNGLLSKLMQILEKNDEKQNEQTSPNEISDASQEKKLEKNVDNSPSVSASKAAQIKIPSGMEPGQLLQYHSASRRKILTFKIPEKRKWRRHDDGHFFYATL